MTTPDHSPPNVTLEASGGVARIELNRPEASNAVDLSTARAFHDAVEVAALDESVRAVVVTGAGVRFCAGGDVASMLAAGDRSGYLEELATTLDAALQRLAGLDKPAVAGVRGAVAGAGLALMLSCDLVVAGLGTRFVTAYAGVGLTPDCGLSWLLPRAVGQQRALDLLLSNRTIGATEALGWGMITETAEDDDVLERALAVAKRLADGPAGAHGQARRLVRESWAASRAETGADETRTIGRAVATDEATRLLTAFRAS